MVGSNGSPIEAPETTSVTRSTSSSLREDGTRRRVQALHVLAGISHRDLEDVRCQNVRICVVQDEGRRLAAELERHRAKQAATGRSDRATHVGGPGEGDLVDAGVIHERDSSVRATGDEVDHAVRHARSLHRVDQQPDRHRGLRAGLEDHGAPREQAGASLTITRLNGKFQGVMSPAMPTGRRAPR